MILSLLRQAADSKQPHQLRRLLALARTELLSHMRAEARTLYASVARHPGAQQVALACLQSHEKLERQLVRAVEALKVDAGSASEAADLRNMFELHVQNEECAIAKAADNTLTQDEVLRLGHHFKRLKRIEQRRLGEEVPTQSGERF